MGKFYHVDVWLGKTTLQQEKNSQKLLKLYEELERKKIWFDRGHVIGSKWYEFELDESLKGATLRQILAMLKRYKLTFKKSSCKFIVRRFK